MGRLLADETSSSAVALIWIVFDSGSSSDNIDK